MPVRINPTNTIKIRLGINPGGRVQRFATHTCRIHMDKYVPYRTGHLAREVVEEPDSVIYVSPYARYQYYGIREDGTHEVKKYTTPGTGKYWDKRMWSVEKYDVIREIQNYIGGK